MKLFLAINTVIALFFAMGSMSEAKSAIHEIFACLSYIVALLSLLGYGVVERLDKMIDKK